MKSFCGIQAGNHEIDRIDRVKAGTAQVKAAQTVLAMHRAA
jgi:hypothetical protein